MFIDIINYCLYDAVILLYFLYYLRIALYNQNILAYNTIGQSDALLSKYSLLKRARVVSARHLPLYPERPGEKDCAYYMMTRTCKFGDACKFDHPNWVPEGGVPDWKEVTIVILFIMGVLSTMINPIT